jgi:hypothetical protein
MLYLNTLLVTQVAENGKVGWSVHNEFEKIWNEAMHVNLRHYTDIFWGDWVKYENLWQAADIPVEIRTDHLPNICQNHHLSIYDSTALVDLGYFFSFSIYTQTVGLLGRLISPSQGRYLHTGQQKPRSNAHRHRCLVWDSNPWSECSSDQREFTT